MRLVAFHNAYPRQLQGAPGNAITELESTGNCLGFVRRFETAHGLPNRDISTLSQPLAYHRYHEGMQARARRRARVDLSSHMALCDANYRKVFKLYPGLLEAPVDGDPRRFVLPVADAGIAVQINVLEQTPYTTLVRLTYGLHPALQSLTEPRLTVRLYHDAESAEVVEYQSQRRFAGAYDYPNPGMRAPDEKTQINALLGEYLSHCLANGVAFESVEIPRS